MLDPRIYRMGLVPVVLAVVVLAFSLGDQQGAVSTNLAPQAFNGASAAATQKMLLSTYPERRPGSQADIGLADYLRGQLKASGFSVSADAFTGRTADGTRTLENVIATRAGQQNSSIVVVADRSARGSPAAASLSATAVLLQLANDFSGETLQHTVVLASISGAAGTAGALALAHTLQRPVEAVLVLGDMAGTTVHHPVVVPWSNSQQVAPPVLRNTVAAALEAQAGLRPGNTGLIAQLAHLTVPMAATGQGPFGAAGLPAVLLSRSGEQGPSANEPTGQAQMSAMGRTVLQTVSALDGARPVPAPSTYLSFSGKTVPAWAVRLLVLALIIPVLVATIDGMARARRRGQPILRWAAWVLSAAAPFALAAILVVLARAVGLIGVAPAVPVAGGAVAPDGSELALLVILACVIVGGVVWLPTAIARMLGLSFVPRGEETSGAGTAAALLLVLCVVILVIWVANPFAALLLVPALHLWLWIVVPDVRLPTPATVTLLLAGLALPVLVALDYASTLGLGPLQVVWSWALLLAGGSVGLSTAIEWSIAAGCAISVVAIAVRAARQPRPEPTRVTIRGPVSYAGPGSLGGTESALRR